MSAGSCEMAMSMVESENHPCGVCQSLSICPTHLGKTGMWLS